MVHPVPEPAAPSARARYVMVGGFLGAGKTTAMAALAQRLDAQGQRVGLITNDQSSGLVDTALLRQSGFPVEEIAGGCFCCRFDSLDQAAARLTAESRPDVFLAEPVGSCTDLVATVSYPLRRIYGDRFHIAPLTVLLDPHRASRILGIAQGRSFSPKVAYVFLKQMEEADILAINKCDTTDRATVQRLAARLRSDYPRARVVEISAKTGDGVDAWLGHILAGEGARAPTMDVDYQVYAEGEAELGWLNATLDVHSTAPMDANALLLQLTDGLRTALARRHPDAEIAHLKLTLDAPDAGGQLSVVSLTGSDGAVDLRESLLDGVQAGSLIVNFRAEAPPEALAAALDEVLAAAGDRGDPGAAAVTFRERHREQFRPAPPVPTHRERIPAGGSSA